MGVVWVVDQPEMNLPEYLSALMSNFPCRVIGSIKSVSNLLKIQSHTKPNVLLVNMSTANASPRVVRELMSCELPATPVVLLFDNSSHPETLLNWQLSTASGAMVAKVRHLLRASVAYQQSKIFMDTFVLDTENLRLEDESQGFSECLTPKEARILRLFMAQKGQCVSRLTIREKVWGGGAVSDRTIDSHISRLRKRLAVTNLAIENIYGDGYVLK